MSLQGLKLQLSLFTAAVDHPSRHQTNLWHERINNSMQLLSCAPNVCTASSSDSNAFYGWRIRAFSTWSKDEGCFIVQARRLDFSQHQTMPGRSQKAEAFFVRHSVNLKFTSSAVVQERFTLNRAISLNATQQNVSLFSPQGVSLHLAEHIQLQAHEQHYAVAPISRLCRNNDYLNVWRSRIPIL